MLGHVARWALALLPPLAIVAACGFTQTGAVSDGSDAGGGTGGVEKVQTGTCFPDAKVCPDPTGQLVCLSTSDPQTGCQKSTSCAPCELPHATPKCATSTGCVPGSCDAGWQDCNTDPSDGCEANAANDPSHCGSCTENCVTEHDSTWLCVGGQCAQNPCQPPTTADCNGDPADACEVNLVDDPNNCGFCGNTCVLPHATAGCAATPSGNPLAQCIVTQCDPGWANCDGIDANGCESSANTDPSSCGGCGKKCNDTNGVPGCSNGVCGIICNPGFGNCDGNADNGCETDLNTHVLHCGSCDNACSAANGTPTCIAGQCTTGGCNGGFSDCDGNPSNGCETDVTNDPNNCGACGRVCAGTANGSPACNNGVCDVTCLPGFSTCGSGTTCYDTVNDPMHCSCNQCSGPSSGSGSAVCSGGACGVTCASGAPACNGACLDYSSDINNCGSCGHVCAQSTTAVTVSCSGGQCVATCNPPYQSCFGKCVNTQSDPGNCGGCGHFCSLGEVCNGGNCACKVGYNDCGSYCAECCNNGDCPAKCCYGKCCSW